MRKTKKGTIMAVAVIALLIAVVALYFYKTQTAWVKSPPYRRGSHPPAKTLVVVYSRTGNTLSAAKEVARYFDADLLRIKAPQYSRDMKGQMLASRHGDEAVTTTPIEHEAVKPGRYDLIVLCAPTWWFRPAPPIWSFVGNHNFAGKPVFLIMTGNSRLKQASIEKFGQWVEEKNGKFLEVLFIRRGRIFWQKNPEQVNEAVRKALELRHAMWPVKTK